MNRSVAHAKQRSAMGRPFLKRLIEKVATTLTAAAFAEESEAEMARQILAQAKLLADGAPSRREHRGTRLP